MWQFSQKGMGKLLALALAVSLIFGSGAFLQPSSAGAEPVSVVPGMVEVDNVALSNNNRDVTISFKTSLSDSTYLDKDLLEGIEIKRTGEGHYNWLSSQGNYEFDEGKLILHLNNPLSGNTNLIRIANDYLADPSGNPLSLSSANPIVVSALELDEFYIVSNVVSDGGHTITLNLSQPAVLRDSVDLKNSITTSDGPLASEDTAELSASGEQVIIHLDEPLPWSTGVYVNSSVLQSPHGPVGSLSTYVNLRPVGERRSLDVFAEQDRDLYVLEIDSAGIYNNLADLDALKAAITVYKDSVVFDGDFEIVTMFSSYDGGYFKLKFASELPMGYYRLSFPANSLKNVSGIGTTRELITWSGYVGTGPQYQGAEVSQNSSGQTVASLVFDRPIDTWYTEENNPGALKRSITYSLKVGEDWIPHNLGAEDSVVFEDNKLVVTFGKKLNGTFLKIKVDSRTIVDPWNLITIDEAIETAALAIESKGSPTYGGAEFDNNNHDVIFKFDEPVQAAPNVDLHRAFTYAANDNALAALDSDATVSFEDNKVILHFPNALIENHYKFSIAAGTLADLSGNVLEEEITVTELKPADLDLAHPEIAKLEASSDLELGKSIIYITFNETIVDNTVVNGVSHLKDYIEVSTDGGNTFSGIGANEWVRLEGNYIVFSYRAGVDSDYRVKVKANAVKDLFGNVATKDLTAIGEAKGNNYLQGNIYTDAETVLTTFSDSQWGSNVYRVLIKKGNEATRPLSEDKYEVVNNTVVIKQGVFSEGERYSIQVYSYGYENRNTDGSHDAISHHETYYMTDPSVLSSSGGIIVTANVIANPNARSNFETVVFQLMKDNQPVANTAVYTYLYAGKVSAYFNVSNPSDYTVKAFVLDDYSGAVDNVGLNLATVVSEEEFDILYLNSRR
ncbi:hypothetical protein SAMN04487969_11235 [Paenibacillus algorifonticola]|uniref:Heme-binding protein Shr-like Hb-interacting domain-containing protein n=2 Tax=Paenibacillus algorifonticola TaxID=684063 RepID=A0A1I2FI24_9BACL|nr:hypothetical protein SAMN04487969_11235 [Paenibacillus algorifonticola]